MPIASTDRALGGAFLPIRTPPVVFNGTATTTPVLLTPDVTPNEIVRRMTVVNKSASQVLSICFFFNGVSFAGATIASGRQILGGGSWDFIVQSNMSVVVVADGSCAYAGISSDV